MGLFETIVHNHFGGKWFLSCTVGESSVRMSTLWLAKIHRGETTRFGFGHDEEAAVMSCILRVESEFGRK